MDRFILNIKTKVYFGENITGEALEKEKALIKPPVMIVTTGRSLYKYGYIDNLKKALSDNCDLPSSEILIWDRVSNNPDISEVAEAVSFARENAVKTVIGFGGGSALDAAKAVAAGIPSHIDITQLFTSGGEPSVDTLPIIAIPTTAGTGSELSKAAILSNRERGVKAGLRGEHIIPRVAIVDSTYTWSVPLCITAETGFDVLAHAIESFISVKSTIYSSMLSEYTISTTSEALRTLAKKPDNHEARLMMSYCSMLMGLNLKDVGTALPHRMQYPIGAHTDTGHGIGLAALYPAWLSHEYECNKVTVEHVLSLMGYSALDFTGSISHLMRTFLAEIGIETSLSSLGIGKISPEHLASEVTGNIANDPLSTELGIIETIYCESM